MELTKAQQEEFTATVQLAALAFTCSKEAEQPYSICFEISGTDVTCVYLGIYHTVKQKSVMEVMIDLDGTEESVIAVKETIVALASIFFPEGE